MSARWEAGLITSVCDSGKLKEAIKAGVTIEDFLDDENRRIWSYILKHYSDPKRGGVPSLKNVKSRFPGFEAMKTSDSIQAIAAQVFDDRIYAELRALMDAVRDKTQKEDAGAALALLKGRVIELAGRKARDEIVDATRLSKSLRQEYEEAKMLKGITGMHLPWACATEDTGGMKGGDLIGIMGRPGSFKSWGMAAVMAKAHQDGHKPLMFTKEMPPKQQARRLVSIFAGVDYRLLRRGKLPPEIERDFFDNLEAWAEAQPFHIAWIRSMGPEALVEIQAAVEEYEPEIIGIDGWYLLGMRDPILLGTLTTGLKDCLVRWNIPGVFNAQMNREAEKSKKVYEGIGAAAYGDALGQDADVVYNFRFTPEDRQAGEVSVFCGKMREDEGRHFTFRARPGSDLSQRAVVSGEFGDGDAPALPPGEDEDPVE